ncbi:Alpha/Beta hydrolase protein [Trichoderma velutinum]
MDISQEVLKFGNSWSLDVNNHFQNIMEPLQAKQNAKFHAKVKVQKGLRYGDGERHRLDLYSSTTPSPEAGKAPVVVYIHGGAFMMGDTDITPSMHGNVGYYFASSGCLGVLATYPLLPTASLPQGIEDVIGIVTWLVKNVNEWGGDPSQIYLIGQSSGGSLLANALFTGRLKAWNSNIRGIVLQSVPLWHNLGLEWRRKSMQQYHRTDQLEEIEANMGLSLFEKCAKEEVEDWPSVLLMLAEFDSDEIVDGNLRFVDAFRKKIQRLPVLEIMKGHNHISYCLGIGLPDNAIGERLLAFVHGK